MLFCIAQKPPDLLSFGTMCHLDEYGVICFVASGIISIFDKNILVYCHTGLLIEDSGMLCVSV